MEKRAVVMKPIREQQKTCVRIWPEFETLTDDRWVIYFDYLDVFGRVLNGTPYMLEASRGAFTSITSDFDDRVITAQIVTLIGKYMRDDRSESIEAWFNKFGLGQKKVIELEF